MSSHSQGGSNGRGAKRNAIVGAIGAIAMAVEATVIGSILTGNFHRSLFGHSASKVSFDKPSGPVSYPWTLTGRVKNLGNVHLWLDVQGDGEQNHHPTDKPCTLEPSGAFTCEDIYIGQKPPLSKGQVFTLTRYSVVPNSAGDTSLTSYGQRNVAAAGAYAGIPSMPADSKQLGDMQVVRA